MNTDTVKLLKSCNLGCKFATSDMEQVLPFVKNRALRSSIEINNSKHMFLASETARLLEENGKKENEPGALALMTGRIKNDVLLGFSSSTRQVASIMIGECETGTKAICKALKNCPKADKESVAVAKEMIRLKQSFLKEMIEYY